MKWEVKKLSEVCDIKPQKKESKQNLSEEDLVSFVPMNNLGILSKDLILEEEKKLKDVYKSYVYFAENDVLLAKITPCFENGKLGIARSLKNGVGFGSSEYVVFRSQGNIDPEYLFYFLSRKQFRSEGARVMSGAVGHKRVPKEFIEDYLIPVPPLEEQKRIVEILDESFAGIERAEAIARQNLTNARELFDSYLNKIFEKPPTTWEKDKLENIALKIGSGATPKGGKNSYKAEGISLIRSLNVHDREFRVKDLAFLDDEQAKKLSNVEVYQDDVLLNITGASIARCCVVPQEYLPARVNQHVSIIRPNKEKINPIFLNYLLTSKIYKDQLLNAGEKAGSTRQALTKYQIQKFTVYFPTLIEQTKIIISLESIEKETQKLEEIYQRKIEALGELKQSILKKAFSGQFTQ